MDQSSSNDRTNNKVVLRKQDQKPIQKPKRFSKLWKFLIHKKTHAPDSPPISETLPPKENLLKNTPEDKADFSSRNLPDLYEVEQAQSSSEKPSQSIVKTTLKCHTSTSDPVDLCNNSQLSPNKTAEEEEDGEDKHIQIDRRHFFISDPLKMHEEEMSEELLGFEISSSDQPSTTVHTQVDYVHYLVPDLQKIFNSSYYWGVMDRYEAEKLLENKPEGTFLLRDSAQEDFLFSVSFRRYNRSLHARIEQWCHKFSFDSHDSNVYSCASVCGLIERYKDPSCLMFFEPMLMIPLAKRTPFSLQSLSRAAVCSAIKYDDISRLPVPKSLVRYLQYYHYKQRVRVRRF